MNIGGFEIGNHRAPFDVFPVFLLYQSFIVASPRASCRLQQMVDLIGSTVGHPTTHPFSALTQRRQARFRVLERHILLPLKLEPREKCMALCRGVVGGFRTRMLVIEAAHPSSL